MVTEAHARQFNLSKLASARSDTAQEANTRCQRGEVLVRQFIFARNHGAFRKTLSAVAAITDQRERYLGEALAAAIRDSRQR
jgi:hypothetical protein